MDQQEMGNSEGRWKVGVCVYVLERLSGYGGTVRGKSTKKMKEGRGNSASCGINQQHMKHQKWQQSLHAMEREAISTYPKYESLIGPLDFFFCDNHPSLILYVVSIFL